MHKLLASAVIVATAFASTAFASNGYGQDRGAPPELDAVKWYNTPPLALKQLMGKAVLVEVFRTW